VMNTPFGNSITTAEHAITLMLALARQIPQADASTQAPGLHVDGVLTEPCERTGCDVNGPSFKGIYVRNVSVSSTMGPGLKIDTTPYR